MSEGLIVILLVIAVGITVTALFVVLQLLFAPFVDEIKSVATASHGRSIVIGFVNTFFLGVITAGLWSISENTGIGILAVIGLLILIFFTIGLAMGLTAIAWMLGEKLRPEKAAWQQTLSGGVLMILSSVTPYVGWFLLLPYLVVRGFGSFIMTGTAMVRARGQRASTE